MRLPSRIGTMSLRSMMAISASASSVAWRGKVLLCDVHPARADLVVVPAAGEFPPLAYIAIVIAVPAVGYGLFEGPSTRKLRSFLRDPARQVPPASPCSMRRATRRREEAGLRRTARWNGHRGSSFILVWEEYLRAALRHSCVKPGTDPRHRGAPRGAERACFRLGCAGRGHSGERRGSVGGL